MNSRRIQIKEGLIGACRINVETRLRTIEQSLISIEESKQSETKSSVGDKYETGRAMLQIEEEKSKRQLFKTNLALQKLSKIDIHKSCNTAELGSLVTTNKGEYFISIGIGKIVFENQVYYCISTNSPIGAKLLGKAVAFEIEFNESKITIQEIN